MMMMTMIIYWKKGYNKTRLTAITYCAICIQQAARDIL